MSNLSLPPASDLGVSASPEPFVTTLPRQTFQRLPQVVRLLAANASEGGRDTFCT